MVAALKFPPLTREPEDRPIELEPMLGGRAGAPAGVESRIRSRGEARPPREEAQRLAEERSYMRMRSRRQSERRIFPRKSVDGRVSGRRIDHSVHAHQMPFLNLSMRDMSVGGLRAQSQDALEPGEHVAVFFPPEGVQRGWDAYGRVIRCLPKGQGYEIAVEFDPLPAA